MNLNRRLTEIGCKAGRIIDATIIKADYSEEFFRIYFVENMRNTCGAKKTTVRMTSKKSLPITRAPLYELGDTCLTKYANSPASIMKNDGKRCWVVIKE